jgi:hypothetical protein
MVTPLTDALMDSIPLVCITGQVPTHLIGNDAFQECDTVGITRPCTKHNWLVKRRQRPAAVIHEAFRVATTGGRGRCGRHPEGRPVRHRHLHAAGDGAAQEPTTRASRATTAPSGRGRADRGGEAAGVLYRRRRHQFRARRRRAAARVRRASPASRSPRR